jgi:HD-GYP domain-containing protein (c-di-GMP phosphodiesterase class II)
MTTEDLLWLDPSGLCTGLYVELDVGWMAHPFPRSSFKISTEQQIATIQGLRLSKVRCIPSKSDPDALQKLTERIDSGAAGSSVEEKKSIEDARQRALQEALAQRAQRAEQLAQQARSLAVCERRFGEASRQYRKTLEICKMQPAQAGAEACKMVAGFVDDMMANGESAIRLLSESSGDKSSMHTVNVTVLSLLLGKAMGFSSQELLDLGVSAFLHDIGKIDLPERVRWHEDSFTSAENKAYQEHVTKSVLMVKSMELTQPCLLAIGQHHELADGGGFPSRLKADQLNPGARVLALINRYDNFCNPSRVSAALTPHEALSLLFAQFKSKFDTAALSAFIRMMGVYPPGSIVQLVDDRFGLVVSVNSSRPLKPKLIVHEAGISRHEALILDLEHTPGVGIRRSVKAAVLPAAILDYLAPRQRVTYFFEKVIEVPVREKAQ